MTADPELKKWLISQLRRISYRRKARTAAKNAARVARNAYTCAHCQGVYPSKQVQLDHVVPVVDPVKGFTSWDDYICRLFCSEDGYQVLCVTCHSKKTVKENAQRGKDKKLR